MLVHDDQVRIIERNEGREIEIEGVIVPCLLENFVQYFFIKTREKNRLLSSNLL